jgi:16S rRNA (adenine(1408)-N(1))-methyltransferase
MAEASRRAARAVERGGVPNALFVIAAAERPPTELLAIADELTINFPWGSLLRGALAIDEAAARGIAALLKPGASLRALISVTPRDGLELGSLDKHGAANELACRWARHGLQLAAVCPATEAETVASHSTWARRLGVGRTRPAWRVILRRPETGAANDDLECAG